MLSHPIANFAIGWGTRFVLIEASKADPSLHYVQGQDDSIGSLDRGHAFDDVGPGWGLEDEVGVGGGGVGLFIAEGEGIDGAVGFFDAHRLDDSVGACGDGEGGDALLHVFRDAGER